MNRAALFAILACIGCAGGPADVSTTSDAQASATQTSIVPTSGATPSTAASDAATATGSVAAPAPLPARFDARVHLPGTDAKRHLTASMENWALTGCISDTAGACDKTRTFDAAQPARLEFLHIWQEVLATPRCEPEGQWPGDRMFELAWLGQKHTGRLPANDAELSKRNEGPCRAHARFAMWFARQFAP